MGLSLSTLQARRLALAAQGFGRRPRGEVLRRQVLACIDRLGLLQIDSVNALVRSHYLPLFSRLGRYPRSLLEQAAWGGSRQRALFECWGHEASLLPLASYPLMRWRMRRAAEGCGIYSELAAFGREQQTVIRQVLQHVRERGALGAGELGQRTRRAGPWWDWSAEKRAMEWLFAAGELCVSTRRGFERLYDLPERVLPPGILNHPEIDETEAQRRLLERAAAALGVATERDLRDYYRLDPADSRGRLAELVEEGALVEVAVQGWDKPGYCLGEPRILRRVEASALLSPFDSLIWTRERTERLFGFRYRLEIYTPAHKRVYGYYVLPFLHDERLVGRVDLRSERAHDRLAVHGLHGELEHWSEEGLAALAGELRRMAGWLGLAEIAITCPRPQTERLRHALALC